LEVCAIILAGGAGQRLWPLSRKNHPKQFLEIDQTSTMLQFTFNRLNSLNIDSSFVVCGEEHRFLVSDQLGAIKNTSQIILEPTSKNTAPAIALAAFEKLQEDPLLLVLSADHLIKDEKIFSESIKKAINFGLNNKIVIFGVDTSKAHTGYGYIKKGKQIDNGFYVESFEEKPSYDLAKKYHADKNYFWNSGIFLFKASKYIEELKKHSPEIYKYVKKSHKLKNIDNNFIRVDKENFTKCPSDSIDYAIIENTDDVIMVNMNCGWSDIGSWSSLWEVSDKDKNKNVKRGDVITHNTFNSFIRSDDDLVVTVGVDNLSIVKTKDALLVADKKESENIKRIFQDLQNKNRQEVIYHSETFRPWGKYNVLEEKDTFKVKKITVNSGAKLSLQKHKFRSEHWVVVSGKATVTKDDKTFLLSENESVYIPVGTMHSLENKEKVLLEIIEVQTGSYLGEDDIERFEDIYGRVE